MSGAGIYSQMGWEVIIKRACEKNNIQPTKENIDNLMEKEGVPPSKRSGILKWIQEDAERENPFDAVFIKQLDEKPYITNCDPEEKNQESYYRSYHKHLVKEGKDELEKSLRDNSLGIIKYIPDPIETKISYKTKGLVVGQIQSGKTANIEALVCRAVDCGYRFIIVLTGTTNNLRIQTQKRFDNEIINSEYKKVWSPLTNEESDFDLGSTSINGDAAPQIAIMKKQKHRLEALLNGIKEEHKNLPALIIDDECDNASINTNANDENADPTVTNQKIRDLLKKFDKAVYVGFSATPFANCFIDATKDDLYPEDFICLLKTPKNYTGTKEFIEKNEENFKIIEEINNNEIPDDILRESIYSFILSCCIAHENKLIPDNNYTMLVHPSLRKKDHADWTKKIEDIKKQLKTLKPYPLKFKFIKDEFEQLFTDRFASKVDESFEVFFKHHGFIIDNIEVITLNSDSSSQDANDKKPSLNYNESNKVYIVIGGNILSRGLTLEGLLTSIFIREAKTTNYDTLLQMQRWCGFRKDYLKFTTIYTSKKIKNYLQELVSIEEDFRNFLKEKYEEEGCNPLTTKVAIQAHEAMRVTSRSKQGDSFEVALNSLPRNLETFRFFPAQTELEYNVGIVKKLAQNKSFKLVGTAWMLETNKEDITAFVDSYKFYDSSLQKRIKRTIDLRNNTDWIIKLHNSTDIENDDESTKSKFNYTDSIKVQEVRRGLYKKDGALTIQVLREARHKKDRDDEEKPQMIIYIIDKASNSYEHTRRKTPVDPDLQPLEPIVALRFLFPKQDDELKNNKRTT